MDKYELTRPTAYQRGYTHKWRKARLAYLAEHTFCVTCTDRGIIDVVAEIVDHVKDHRGNLDLFWDTDNWQALCKKCHDRKTLTGSTEPKEPTKNAEAKITFSPQEIQRQALHARGKIREATGDSQG